MKTFISALSGLVVVSGLSLAFANPALLPKHPGYPGAKAQSPVTGQSLSNDPGETNLGGAKALEAAAEASGKHVVQNLSDSNNQRIVKKEGAGRLPQVQGPQIKIEPPVKEATRMPK